VVQGRIETRLIHDLGKPVLSHRCSGQVARPPKWVSLFLDIR
jgi:hypothetical protein